MTALFILQLVVVTCLIGVILIQRSATDGLLGGGGGDAFMTGSASRNFMTRLTAILATVFIINSLVLAYMASHRDAGPSIGERIAEEAEIIVPSVDEESTQIPAEPEAAAPEDLTPTVPIAE